VFSLKNTSNRNRRLLLDVGGQGFTNSQLYLQRSDSIDFIGVAGDHLPFEQRLIQHRNHLFPMPLDEYEEVVCYFKVNSIKRSPNFHIQLWDKVAYFEHNGNVSTGYGIFIGLGLTFLALLMTLITIFSSNSLLSYFYYLCSLLLYFLLKEGFIYQFIWPFDNSILYQSLQTIWPFISTLFLIHIGEEYLDRLTNKEKSSIIYHRVKIITYVLLAIIFILSILKTDFQYVNVACYIALILGLILMVSSVSTHTVALSKNDGFRQVLEPLVICFITTIHIVIVSIICFNIYIHAFKNPAFISSAILVAFIIETLIVTITLVVKFRSSINERIRLSLLNSQQELELANTILKGQKKERVQITKIIESSLAPLLSQLSNKFQRQYSLEEPSTLGQNIANHLDQSKLEVIRIANDVNPKIVSKNSLIQIIKDYCGEIEEVASFDIEFTSVQVNHNFTDLQKVNIYRIVQELLNNVIKHAFAKLVKIEIEQLSKELIISFEDNGIGVTNKRQRFNSLSLRTEKLNGEIHIIKSKVSGLKIQIIVPLANE